MSGRTPGDSLPALAVSRAQLATAPGRSKLQLILDQPDPRAFLRRLPAEDVYFALKEIGLDDCAELIGLATPLQFRTFVDLDAWDRELPDASRVLHWLRLAREGATHEGDFRTKRKALDKELIVLLLKNLCVMHELEEGVDPAIQSDNWLTTAEGKYIVEISAEGDDGVMVRRLLEDFIEESPFEATRLFEAVRWELASELEESGLRWRNGRLRDLGFPDLEEAIRIWTPTPPTWKPGAPSSSPGPVAGVPALLLATSRAPLLLDRIAERLSDEDRPLFNEGLLYLLNCSLVAEGVEPRELDHAREVLANTRDTLSLGLELASDGNEDVALGILASTPAVELFRHAVAFLVQLSKEATQAAKGLAFGLAQGTVLDSPDTEILAGLRRKRPKLYEAPKPGEKRRGPLDWRSLRSRADVATARGAIARAHATTTILANLGLDAAAVHKLCDESGRAISAVTAGPLVLTRAVAAHLGEPAPLAPESAARVAAIFEAGKLRPDARAGLEAFLDAAATNVAAEPFADLRRGWLARLEDEVGPPAAAGPLDPRYVDCVLFRG